MRKLVILTATVSVFALAACGGGEEPAAEGTDEAAPGTITEIVRGNEELSSLLAAVRAAGLAKTLSDQGPFTLFAPTDAAFAALPQETLRSLLKPENADQLTEILTYHVVPAEVPASEVTPGDVETVNSADLTVSVEDGNVVLEDGQGNEATVAQTEIEASNGVIHVIDAVLLPPSA